MIVLAISVAKHEIGSYIDHKLFNYVAILIITAILILRSMYNVIVEITVAELFIKMNYNRLSSYGRGVPGPLPLVKGLARQTRPSLSLS